jgi:hypothetical protein
MREAQTLVPVVQRAVAADPRFVPSGRIFAVGGQDRQPNEEGTQAGVRNCPQEFVARTERTINAVCSRWRNE